MKKITNIKPYFDEEKNLYFPKNIKFGGETNPPLKVNEWWFLILTIADKNKLPKGHIEMLFSMLAGSKSMQYKIKRSLKEKGYL